MYIASLTNSLKDVQVSLIPVDHQGLVDMNIARELIDENTALVTVMHSNNETGSYMLICISCSFNRNFATDPTTCTTCP